MNTYTIKELLTIQDMVEKITGKGYDYDLPMVIEDNQELFPEEEDRVIKESLIQYLCMCPDMIRQGDYIKMGIEELIFESDLKDMPLYVSSEGEEILKQIVAKWRMKLGK
jgi:hypothetical protein